MAKFNKTNTIKNENCSGHVAYSMSKKEQLMTAVVTTMFGEEKYYIITKIRGAEFRQRIM